ncbi:MAG: phosphoribosylglycinamide formyltransferase [Syntrophomonadaceae bacterium]|nr:phosphoribosylglycinamide formyltransferase [Syntrophomonadaceae bacterium]
MIRIMEPGFLRLGVIASGRGSNFEAICDAIETKRLSGRVMVVISDQKDAPVLEKAARKGIPYVYIEPPGFASRDDYEVALVKELKAYQVELVVLAGYMRLVGEVLLNAFKLRMVNIHPSLLPSFPGLRAQKQALDYGVRYSGCTVHLVDKGMDTGPIIMQSVVPVLQEDNESTLSERILQEEHQLYWKSLQLFAEGRLYIEGRKVFIK